MSKILLISHSGFSNQNANGITMKNLLSGWAPEEKAEFYCDVQSPDFTAASHYFRVTDMEMIKAFWGKRAKHRFDFADSVECGKQTHKSSSEMSSKIPAWLKRRKYNFCLKWLREIMWMLSPWGHRDLEKWVDEFNPDIIVYMVGESLFMDKLVLKICRDRFVPLVLYNGEAFRIINLKERHGLERAYYRKAEKLYGELSTIAVREIYNSDFLKEAYERKYLSHGKSITVYNSAKCTNVPYESHSPLKITYFGNLGVGRVESLLETAEVLYKIDSTLFIDVYGTVYKEDKLKFERCSNIRFHGFVSAEELNKIMCQSDILLHVESFDPAVVDKLKYAFSTKIAQCLCAGRSFLTYAPVQTASTQYLISTGGAVVATNREELSRYLKKLVTDEQMRYECAACALEIGKKNHSQEVISKYVKADIGALLVVQTVL